MGRHGRDGRRAPGPDRTPPPDAEPAVGHGHGHGHGHGPAAPAGRRVRVLLAVLLVPCALASVVGALVLYPFGADHRLPPDKVTQLVKAEVAASTPAPCAAGQPIATTGQRCVALSMLLQDGPATGRGIVTVVPIEPGTPVFEVGDDVVLGYNGGDPADTDSYSLSDYQRGAPLWILGLLFAGSVIALGRWRGVAALVALGASFVVLVGFMLPAILDGRSPLAVAVAGACLIMFIVLYVSHGLSARTSTAVLGTLVSLGLIGVLGTVFAGAARLTGLDDETQSLIGSLGPAAPDLDPRGLLLAGFVIGALGVLDDVTVTQTSAVWELRRANPDMGVGELFASAMRIGRDHVSSAVNTLVLAYAGASLPLMLLFVVSRYDVAQTLTTQSVATEVVRTLVGSIGLVASVPVTTGVAALVASQEEVPSGRS